MSDQQGGGGVPPLAEPRDIKVLETAEEIQARREQVLQRYENFKDAAKVRRDKLEDARAYQYFKRDADELEAWINEKLQTANEDSYKVNYFFRDELFLTYLNRSIFTPNLGYN